MVYFAVFLSSIIFVSLGAKNEGKGIGKLLVFLGLCIPCVLAGIRDLSVGTDTNGYIYNVFKIAQGNNNIFDFFKIVYQWYMIKDYLYLILTFIFSKITFISSFQLLLFIYELLIVFPMYYALKNFTNDNKKISFGLLLIYLSLYNLSLNMVRQSIAIAFFLYSFSVFFKREDKWKIKSIISLLIAFLFHETVLFTIPLFFIFNIIKNDKIQPKTKSFITILTVLGSIFLLLFYKNIIILLSQLGLFSKGNIYLNKYGDTFDFNYLGTLLNLTLIFSIVISKKTIQNNKLEYKFGFFLSVLNLIISFLGFFIQYAGRLSYYLMFLLITMYLSNIYSNKKKNYLYILIILLVFIVYWLWIYVINNSGETFPFVIFQK